MSQLPDTDPLKSGTCKSMSKVKEDQSRSFSECLRIGVEYIERLEQKLRKQIANFDGCLDFHSNVSDPNWFERAKMNGTIFAFSFKHVIQTLWRTFNHESDLMRVNMIYYDNNRFGDSFVLNSYDMESKVEDLHVTLNSGVNIVFLVLFILHKHRIAQEDGVVTNRLFLYTKVVGNWDECIRVTNFKSCADRICPSMEISLKFFKKPSIRSIELDRLEDCSKLIKLAVVISHKFN
ncbi:hypothetical protein Ddc_03047 [Ditylenchus destructor]|nr:hypothetical protein Ddc_03047 [Ditylenchus destructor]